jgi:DNA-binding MarR family transcriptional regulator
VTAATTKATGRRASAELAASLRPPLLRLTRLIRNQRVDMSVTLTQISAMATLAKRGPMSAGELAACEKVQPPSMTKVLANLEVRGLVRREQHPNDKRQAIISVTDAGLGLLESERKSRDAWLSLRLAELSPDERAKLHDVIPILDKLAEQ